MGMPTMINSAEQARRLLVLARILDIPTHEMLDAMRWVNGDTMKAPSFIPEPDR